MAARCDARHSKNLESMAEMKLQKAAAKLISKEWDCAQYREVAGAVARFVLLRRPKGIIYVNLSSSVRN